MRPMLAFVLTCFAAIGAARFAVAGNFSTGAAAHKFGVHEVALTGDGGVANPFDTLVTVTFTPPSGSKQSRTVSAFYDGENAWRARAYVSESGAWRWESHSATDSKLDGKSGGFEAAGLTMCREGNQRLRASRVDKRPKGRSTAAVSN
jgi:hypothetical protein